MNKKICLSLSGNNLIIDNSPFFIRGGEIQYFRMPKTEWRDRLEKAVEGGLNTVTSYMPWYFHEYEEGKFDFSGETLPERDIRSFLKMAGELDLKFIARPGPYVNSELRFGGLPKWLCKNHPEILSRRAEGNIVPGTACPAEGETAYRNYVKKWFDKVIPIIAEFQMTQGGSVIMFQPDNELSAAWSYGLFNSLYDAETIAVRWPDWLRRKYKKIKELNRNYSGMHYEDFSKVQPPREFAKAQSNKQLAMDWLDFKRYFFADWGATMAEWAIELGIEVPFIFNEPVAGFYGHGDHSGFGSVIKERGIQAVTACHTYSDRVLDLEGVQNMLLGIELVKASPLGGPALTLEANALWYTPRLNRMDLNWSILMRFGLGHGLNGHAIYSYTEGIVDLKDVIEGPEYFGPGCIGIDGKLNGSYHVLCDYFKFVESWEREICLSTVKPELVVAYTAGMRYLDFLGAPQLTRRAGKDPAGALNTGGGKFDVEPGIDLGQAAFGHDWTDGYEGVSKQTVMPESGIWRKFKEVILLSSRLNLAIEVSDLMNPKKCAGEGVLAVPNTGCLEKQAIDYLIQHLELGGTCIFTPAIPMFNLDGHPDLRLMKMLGAGEPELIRPAGGVPLDYGCRIIETEGVGKFGSHSWLFHYPINKDNTVLATWQNKPLARCVQAGNGLAVIVGFEATYTSKGTLNFWDMIFRKHCGINPSVNVRGDYYNAVLRQGADFNLLTATNIEGRFGSSTIKVKDLPEFELELQPLEGRMLIMNTPCASNRIIYTTSEITPLDRTRSTFKVSGFQGTKGEIAFAEPVTARIGDNERISFQRDGLNILTYSHEPDLKITLIN